MMHFSEPIPLSSTSGALADHVRLAAAAYLGRFKGSSREHTQSDLRCYLSLNVQIARICTQDGPRQHTLPVRRRRPAAPAFLTPSALMGACNGNAPIAVWSGNRRVHRLSPHGNRASTTAVGLGGVQPLLRPACGRVGAGYVPF